MKKWLMTCLCVFLAVTLAACSGDAGSSSGKEKTVLFIGTGTGGDAVVSNRFSELGYTVTTTSASEVDAQKAEQYAIVYVSSSVKAGELGTKVKDAAVPVIFAAPHAMSESGLAGSENYIHYGHDTSGSEAKIARADHPVAAGLSETVNLYNSAAKIGYIVPGKDGIVIASDAQSVARAYVAVYEKGALNVKDEPIPARRAYFYFVTSQEKNVSEEGWKIFDAAVQWAYENP